MTKKLSPVFEGENFALTFVIRSLVTSNLASVVQMVRWITLRAIHWINRYLVDNAIGFPSTYRWIVQRLYDWGVKYISLLQNNLLFLGMSTAILL